MKKVAIIGAGFTGLSAAHELQKRGDDVSIFEKENVVGGLAAGFKPENWEQSLEFHYHHLFTNDKFATSLMKEVGVDFFTLLPVTSIFKNSKKYPFDSPLSLLKFPLLNFFEKIRVGAIIILFKLLSYKAAMQLMENKTAFDLMPRLMGQHAFDIIFQPLFKAKFGDLAEKISAIWFWARINKRTTKLIYPSHAFQKFAQKIAGVIEKQKGKIFLNTAILKIEKNEKWKILTKDKEYHFDQVIFTCPMNITRRLLPELPDYKVKHLDALNLILETNKPILENEYWLNINEQNYPFLALIQQTNFIDKKRYGNNHVAYLGNYLPREHEFFALTKDELIAKYLPFIQKINPQFKEENILNSFLFHGIDAQPVVEVGYKDLLPPYDLSQIDKKFEGLFLANMDMVYPWDRGVNYAIELGYKVADIILLKF